MVSKTPRDRRSCVWRNIFGRWRGGTRAGGVLVKERGRSFVEFVPTDAVGVDETHERVQTVEDGGFNKANWADRKALYEFGDTFAEDNVARLARARTLTTAIKEKCDAA